MIRSTLSLKTEIWTKNHAMEKSVINNILITMATKYKLVIHDVGPAEKGIDRRPRVNADHSILLASIPYQPVTKHKHINRMKLNKQGWKECKIIIRKGKTHQ